MASEMQEFVAPVSARSGMLRRGAEELGTYPRIKRSGPCSTAMGPGSESLTCYVITFADIVEKYSFFILTNVGSKSLTAFRIKSQDNSTPLVLISGTPELR